MHKSVTLWGKMQLSFILITKYNFLVDPFGVTNQAKYQGYLEFITKVGIALAEVTKELQGSFTLQKHYISLPTLAHYA